MRERETPLQMGIPMNVPFTKGKCRLDFTALMSAASPLPLAQNSPPAQVAFSGAYSGLRTPFEFSMVCS